MKSLVFSRWISFPNFSYTFLSPNNKRNIQWIPIFYSISDSRVVQFYFDLFCLIQAIAEHEPVGNAIATSRSSVSIGNIVRQLSVNSDTILFERKSK